MKAALVDDNGIVVNVIVWDDACVAPNGITAVVVNDDLRVSVGWIYNGGQDFADPNPPAAVEPLPVPTLQELQAQLAELTVKIQAMS